MEEITYSWLVDKICTKIKIDESTMKRKLSYIPTGVKPPTYLYIRDDDDVYVYLTTLDEEKSRSVLHVEVGNELEMVDVNEQQSRVQRKSSVGVNYEEENFGGLDNDDRANVGAITLYANEPLGEQLAEPLETLEPLEPLEPLRDVDNGVNSNMSMSKENDGIREYVEEPRDSQHSKFKGPWDDGLDLVIGQEFENSDDVKYLVETGANRNCFGLTLLNSNKKRYVVKCAEEGCEWYIRFSKAKDSTRFSVRTYRKLHTCVRSNTATGIKRRGTPRLVATVLHEDYPGQYKTPTPKSLIGLVQGKHGTTVSYSTAIRGKKLAVSDIRACPEESFKMVYQYLYMLEKVNPGTKTSVVLDEEKRFKYLFVALGAAIEGFKVMRKVIIVDATFLKTIYKGVLIFATAQDPNHHHYPLAFAVADGEKDVTWKWFFKTLKTVIPDSSELVFMSDRNSSLIKAVAEVYPSSHHGNCVYHLSQNVRTKVAYNKEGVAKTFRRIASICSVSEFEHEYAEFRRRHPKVATYLDENTDLEKWARCHFPGVKYNIDTSNAVESMNGVFRDVRGYALLPMIDAIIGKFAEWSCNNRKEALSGSNAHRLVPFVENEIHETCEVAQKLPVIELNTYELQYSVIGRDGKTYVVDLRNKSCYCRCFDLDKYPCVHAIAAVMTHLKQKDRSEEVKSLYDLITKYYFVEMWVMAYVRTIYPVPHKSEWVIPSEIQELFAYPPVHVVKKGRVQETRHPSVGERRPKNKRVKGRNLESWFFPNHESDSQGSGQYTSGN